MEQPVHPVGPQQAARSPACDFQGAAKEASSYFPGNGKNSTAGEVRDLLDLMEDACNAGTGNEAAYTELFYDVATIVQDVLMNREGGDAESGASLLTRLTTMLGPELTPMFDSCAGAPDCTSWEGYPTPLDFLSVLIDPHGTWAVLNEDTDTDVVCSGFRFPCLNVDPADGAWGAQPSPNWQTALFGRTTLMIGHPIPDLSPTDELLAETGLPAYRYRLSPDPTKFAEGSEVFVGLCSDATPTVDELLIQKGSTVLNEVSIDWCNAGQPAPSLLQGLARFLSPVPAPLTATALASFGPGGRAGSYTDFFVIDASDQAILELQSQPADGTVGQPILGQDGLPLTLRTFTAEESPLENALIVMTVIGNSGLFESGNDISDTETTNELSCTKSEEFEFECEGHTQADEDPLPGSLVIAPVITKPGQYSLCFEADLDPLVFNNPVCTEKFIVNP